MPPPDIKAGCHAIVLAAGGSRRFGSAKLLAEFRGEPLVCWSVRAALGSAAERVIVVLGSSANELEAALPLSNDGRTTIAECENWAEGLSASLRCGLATLPPATRAALIFLADMPDLDPALANRLLDEVLCGAIAALPEHAGQPGHPVALSSGLFPRLMKLQGDRGAAAVLEGLEGVVRIPTEDARCVADVDTRADIDALE